MTDMLIMPSRMRNHVSEEIAKRVLTQILSKSNGWDRVSQYHISQVIKVVGGMD